MAIKLKEEEREHRPSRMGYEDESSHHKSMRQHAFISPIQSKDHAIQRLTSSQATRKKLKIYFPFLIILLVAVSYILFVMRWEQLFQFQESKLGWIPESVEVHDNKTIIMEDNMTIKFQGNTAIKVQEEHSTKKDLRRSIERPFMTTVSRTFMDSVQRIEEGIKPNPSCSAFGGITFLNSLCSTKGTLLKKQEKGDNDSDKSQIILYVNDKMEIFVAENVSIVVEHPNIDGDLEVNYKLEVNGVFENGTTASSSSDETLLSSMTNNIQQRSNGIPECTEYIDYPVMLVDNDVDTNNWWFFLKSVLKHYILMTVVQPHVMGDYQKHLRVMHSVNNYYYQKPFFDAFDILFADGRGRDSKQLWLEQPLKTEGKQLMNANNDANLKKKNRNRDVSSYKFMVSKRYCFRKLVWSPGGTKGADEILKNHQHSHSSCFSSIVYSYAAYLKAALHIPTLPRPQNPRVIWVGRDSSPDANLSEWQRKRIVQNQNQIISYLKEECNKIDVDLIVADFYGEKIHTAFQEQALLASRANIMIGVHGAGLNMFHFLPFNSVIVEIHIGTSIQKNSANYVNHIGEGKYINMNMRVDSSKNLDSKSILKTLGVAINEWKKLG